MTEAEGFAVGIFGGLTVAGILEYFSMTQEGLIIMTVMLILDLIFGLLSAKARGEQIQSKKLQQGLIKKMTRRILPFIVALGLKRTGMPGIEALITAIVGMIVFSELYSIIGHIYSINYKEELPEVDAFKMLLNSLVKIIKSIIKKTDEQLDKDEEEKDSDLSENE